LYNRFSTSDAEKPESNWLSTLGGVGHCFAWHVQVSLGFYFNFKTENLYIVGCVPCDIWDITVYFLLPELKYYHEK
jgi:hypothetical protein